MLSNFITTNYDYINRGNCFYFASLLFRYFNIKNYILIYDSSGEEEDPIHIYAKIGKYYYDGLGFHSLEEIKSDYDVTKEHIIQTTINSENDFNFESGGLSCIILKEKDRQAIEKFIKNLL